MCSSAFETANEQQEGNAGAYAEELVIRAAPTGGRYTKSKAMDNAVGRIVDEDVGRTTRRSSLTTTNAQQTLNDLIRSDPTNPAVNRQRHTEVAGGPRIRDRVLRFAHDETFR